MDFGLPEVSIVMHSLLNTAGIATVSMLDYTAMFCSSMDLFETSIIGNETTFCTITGMYIMMTPTPNFIIIRP